MITIHQPHPRESLDDYLDRHGIIHFSAKETRQLKRIGVIAPEPQMKLWPNAIPALWLGERLRERMKVFVKNFYIVVGNGFRPSVLNKRVGGSRFSAHLTFHAFDYDLPRELKGNRHIEELFYTTACELFLQFGKDMKIGIGLYRPWHGSRVHIDCKRRRYWKAQYVKPILKGIR
jgi:hypothetical protein